MSKSQQASQSEWLQIFLKYIRERGVATHVAEDEGYKFRAVNQFQANIDLDSTDLAGNIEISIVNNNLVTGAMYFPRKMLLIYAQLYPEETREILKNLYDETREVSIRITETKEKFEQLENTRAKDLGQKQAHTFIGLRFISLLLGYMYPDKHNALKPSEWKVYASYIDPEFSMPRGTPAGEQYKIYCKYIEPLRELLVSRKEIAEIKDKLTGGLSFSDEQFRWMTQDVIFVTARVFADERANQADDHHLPEGAKSSDNNETADSDIDDYNTGFMAFEQHLEEYVIKNWQNIRFGEELSIYVEDDGTTGQQYTTTVGILDILARDKNNDFVVIELKRAESGYKVVGQILNYMGWVEENLAKKGQKVRGMIIVGKADKTLLSAVKPVSDKILIKEYKITLNLHDTT